MAEEYSYNEKSLDSLRLRNGQSMFRRRLPFKGDAYYQEQKKCKQGDNQSRVPLSFDIHLLLISFYQSSYPTQTNLMHSVFLWKKLIS